MSLINKPFTFTVGTTIVASEHNSNFDIVYACVNGNIDNSNISGSAAIVDSKLAQISTASKVSGAALTALNNVPSGASQLPVVNGGTGQDFSTALIGGMPYISNVGTFSILASGTSGTFLKFNGGGTAPSASAIFSASVLDYGTSSSVSTQRGIAGSLLKLCYGIATLSSGDVTISNLPFTSSTSYGGSAIRLNAADVSQAIQVKTQTSSSLAWRDSQGTNNAVLWVLIGT